MTRRFRPGPAVSTLLPTLTTRRLTRSVGIRCWLMGQSVQAAADVRQQLRHAEVRGGRNQVDLPALAQRRLERLGPLLGPGQVEVGLVDGHRFHEVRVPAQHGHDLARGLLVGDEAPLGEHALDLPHALRAARTLLREHRPDVILVNADPFAATLLGARLARESGVPLILDLRDPWALCELRRPMRPAISRMSDGRYAMGFGLTTLILRPDGTGINYQVVRQGDPTLGEPELTIAPAAARAETLPSARAVAAIRATTATPAVKETGSPQGTGSSEHARAAGLSWGLAANAAAESASRSSWWSSSTRRLAS